MLTFGLYTYMHTPTRQYLQNMPVLMSTRTGEHRTGLVPRKARVSGSQRCSSFVQWEFDFTISKCFSSKVNHENGD